jgi:hypothetical protein
VLTTIHEFLVIFAKIAKHSFAFTTFTTYKKVKVDYYLFYFVMMYQNDHLDSFISNRNDTLTQNSRRGSGWF